MSNNLNEIRNKIDILKKTRKSIILATINNEGAPLASYSPYVEYTGKLYLYLSSLSEHKQNIIENKKLSVLFIEDEKDAKLIALRERLTYEGLGELIEDSTLQEQIQNLFVIEHGKSYETLPKMHDFSLIEVSLGKGRYVFGFGNAYEIDGHEIKHINNK